MSRAVRGAGGYEDEAVRWIGAEARRREEGGKQSGIERGEGSYEVARRWDINGECWGAGGWGERYGGRDEVGAVRTKVETLKPRPASCGAYLQRQPVPPDASYWLF